MKLSFTPPNDGIRHTYCLTCNNEAVTDIFVGELQKFHCSHCGNINDRALIIDPAIRWWTDDTGEYWHESAGVFLRNPYNQFLFFERTKSPYGITIPAGHVDTDELPETAAMRELGEEVGIHVPHVAHAVTVDIPGDACRRGADIHHWHVYTASLPLNAVVTVNDEGMRPVWLTLTGALDHNLTFAVRYLITHYADLL